MRYMGWSWEDYLEAPQELVDEVLAIFDEQEEAG